MTSKELKGLIVQQEIDLSEHVTMAAGCCNIWIEQAIMSMHMHAHNVHAHNVHAHTHTHTHTHTYTHTAYAMHTATIREELEKCKSSLLTICNQSKPFSPPMSSCPFMTCYFRSSKRHPAARKWPEENRPTINSTSSIVAGHHNYSCWMYLQFKMAGDIRLLPS